MPRVGIVALLQESNTFLAARTELAQFEADLLLRGEAVRDALAAAHHEVGGFFSGLDRAGIEAVPVFAARAMPYGTMSATAFARLMDMLETSLAAAGRLDGVLVAPHGATVSEQVADVDGHWLRLVRGRVGNVPVIGTIDPHANLSPAMVAATDALTAYRTNPHVDQQARGLEAARLMAMTLAGAVRPVQAAAFPPLAINIECQNPAAPPCLPHYESAARMREAFEADARPPAGAVPAGAVLSTSVVLGFPYADVPEMGAATLVVTNGDGAAAERHATALAAGLWRDRVLFEPELLSVGAAVERALDLPSPVCLLDMGDNVGGGSPADGTVVARAFHERRIAGTFACLCDAEAARRAAEAGVSAMITIAVGGRSPEWRDAPEAGPLAAEWRVAAVTDGRFGEAAPRHGGVTSFDQGLTAVLETPHGLTVMVTTRRIPPFSLGQVRHAGLDPSRFRILAAKGVHAPVAAYGEVCRSFVRANTPGVTTADLTRLRFAHRRRPMFPFEPDATWEPHAVGAVTRS